MCFFYLLLVTYTYLSFRIQFKYHWIPPSSTLYSCYNTTHNPLYFLKIHKLYACIFLDPLIDYKLLEKGSASFTQFLVHSFNIFIRHLSHAAKNKTKSTIIMDIPVQLLQTVAHQPNPTPLHVFVNGILLEHNHAQLLTYRLWQS